MPRDGSRQGAFDTWVWMRQRCNNPNNPQWKNYGGRGITVRFSSFDEFFAEVGGRPDCRSIDRIDPNGDYAPGNVRWATSTEQQRNRRDSLFIEINGEKRHVMALAEQYGIARDTIVHRSKKGLPLSEILSPDKHRDLSGLALGGKVSGTKRRQRTHCLRGHEFTPENTRTTVDGRRKCRVCCRVMGRTHDAARKLRRVATNMQEG
jgi:hypothetical protein